MKSANFRVYLNNKHIDTVFYDCDMSADEVKTSLVNHDGYNPAISVVKN
jgi:hypothetical protein